MLRIGWFTSSHDARVIAAFEAVLTAVNAGDLGVVPSFVLLAPRPGWPPARDLAEIAGRAFLPVFVADPQLYRVAGDEGWRARFERDLVAMVEPCALDLALLIGYQWRAGPTLLDRYRAVNFHPALPDGPLGTEVAVLEQLVHSNATESGLMAHVVTAELDRGPVLTFARFPITAPTDKGQPRGDATAEIKASLARLLAPFCVASLAALAGADLSTWPPPSDKGWPLDLSRDKP